MPRVPLSWLGDLVALPEGVTAEQVARDLVSVGLEEDSIIGPSVTGPLVVGRVLTMNPEPQKNGKTINWCTVDVGPEHNVDGSRGIVCGAHNFAVDDLVVVALPGTVLPGPFPISARKTYGHVSDGMICSQRELGLGADHDGIIVLTRLGFDPGDLAPGQDAVALLGLDESVVEINVTPDRGYCFAMRGVAREYSHSTGARFVDPADIEVPEANGDGPRIVLDDRAPIRGQLGCDRFAARVVRGVDAARPSPQWMQRRLTLAGMRPISLAVDVTNYVMLELGQPMHAYDLRQVSGAITVRRAKAGEQMRTLDDVLRQLHPEDLLITDAGPLGVDGSRILGLAGVMGGAESEIVDDTTELLLEAAHFSPLTVARTSRRHKLSSEASKRFERGVDPALPPVAIERAAQLLVSYGGGRIDDGNTDVDERPNPISFDFDLSFPSRIVGIDYSETDVLDVLAMIGCTTQAVDGSRVRVTVPSWRPDLVGPIHLVEEVARLRGYDAIPSVLPVAPASTGLTFAQRARQDVARTLAEAGLTQVLSSPFVGEEINDLLGVPHGDPRRIMVRLLNPLSEERPFLRSSLVATLLETVRRNVSRGMADLAVYEIGAVPTGRRAATPAPILPVDRRPDPEDLAALVGSVPEQPQHVAGAFVGLRELAGWWGDGRPAQWTDAVETTTRVVEILGLGVVCTPAAYAPWHPGRCAAVSVIDPASGGPVQVGHAGEIHPEVLAAMALPARLVAFDIDLDALIAVAERRGRISATPISAFPVAKEDIALVVAESVAVGELLAVVRMAAGALAEDVRVFDVYRGEQLPAGTKSVAFSLRLRAADRTLTAAEAAGVREDVVSAAALACGASLRS